LRITAQEAAQMNTNLIRRVAYFAWAAAAVSIASTANATVVTNFAAAGGYASCSASYSANYKPWCREVETGYIGFETFYSQNMKFISTPCNSGGCADTGSHYVDFRYTAGRKQITSSQQLCYDLGTWFYELDTCSC
jgi:hypothetical protein